MFEKGDAVFHPGKGAGIVMGITAMPVLPKRRCYKIKMADQRAKTILMVPVKKVADVGLRYAVSGEDVEAVWRVLGAEPVDLPAKHKLRYKLLKDKLRTGDILALAEAIRDMEWRKAKEQRLNAPGQRIYTQAMRMLSGELSVVLDIDMLQAEQRILDHLNLPEIDEEEA